MNNQPSKTAEEEAQMMDLSQEGTGPASSTSMPDDSILDKSDDNIEEMEQTSSIIKEGAKNYSGSVSALAHNFTKVRVGSENVFLSAGQSNSTSIKSTSSVRAPEPPKQEGGGTSARVPDG